jgi:hypothetical protein
MKPYFVSRVVAGTIGCHFILSNRRLRQGDSAAASATATDVKASAADIALLTTKVALAAYHGLKAWQNTHQYGSKCL